MRATPGKPRPTCSVRNLVHRVENFCDPDSAPIQTSAQPARRSASTVPRVIRSQRVHLEGNPRIEYFDGIGKPWSTADSAKMSSANQM
jgi:hypothetical protein